MGKKTKSSAQSNSGMDIPDYVFDSIARSLLPVIQAYYETEEGQKSFEEWQERQRKTAEEKASD